MPTPTLAELHAELAQLRWAPRTPFSARLAKFRELVQSFFSAVPPLSPFEPRTAVTPRLTLDELAPLLPPTEQRLLAHLRARQRLRDLIGQPGFHSASRMHAVTQRVLSRINRYCGSAVRNRLMQPYERPGHAHRRRPGPRRRLLPADRFPALVLWLPAWWFARANKRYLRRVREQPDDAADRWIRALWSVATPRIPVPVTHRVRQRNEWPGNAPTKTETSVLTRT